METSRKRWYSLIKKEKIDIIVSNGDYFPFHYRKLWFEHCYQEDVELWEVIGKKEYKALIERDLKDGERAMKKLNASGVPVVTVWGNVDYTRTSDVHDMEKPQGRHYWKWDWQDFFSPLIKKYKNIQRIDYRAVRLGDYVFVGCSGGSFPGHVKSKTYWKSRKKLDALFKKYRKENKNGKVIFVSHNVPYDTKLDKIGKDAHETVRGQHYGSKLVKRVIERYQPVMHVGGHIHEGRGKDLIGDSVCVNPGAAHDGQAAIIEINQKGKVKVRFIK